MGLAPDPHGHGSREELHCGHHVAHCPRTTGCRGPGRTEAQQREQGEVPVGAAKRQQSPQRRGFGFLRPFICNQMNEIIT